MQVEPPKMYDEEQKQYIWDYAAEKNVLYLSEEERAAFTEAKNALIAQLDEFKDTAKIDELFKAYEEQLAKVKGSSDNKKRPIVPPWKLASDGGKYGELERWMFEGSGEMTALAVTLLSTLCYDCPHSVNSYILIHYAPYTLCAILRRCPPHRHRHYTPHHASRLYQTVVNSISTWTLHTSHTSTLHTSLCTKTTQDCRDLYLYLDATHITYIHRHYTPRYAPRLHQTVVNSISMYSLCSMFAYEFQYVMYVLESCNISVINYAAR